MIINITDRQCKPNQFQLGLVKSFEIYNRALPFQVHRKTATERDGEFTVRVMGAFNTRELAEEFVSAQKSSDPDGSIYIIREMRGTVGIDNDFLI